MQLENEKMDKNKSPKMDYAQLLRAYLDHDTQGDAVDLAQSDLTALELLIQFESMLALHHRNTLERSDALPASSVLDIITVAELFFHGSDLNEIEKVLKRDARWQKIQGNPADFALFQDALNFLTFWDLSPLIPTPEYLKKIVMSRLYSEIPRENENTIVVRLKEGLRLIAGHVKQLYELSNPDAMVAVRGDLNATQNSATGALQFMTQEKDHGELYYQIVKDGRESVMLTVKLQNYRPRPKFINLRKEGRLLQSVPLKEDFAWFSQLGIGDYEVELKNSSSMPGTKVDIHIV